MQDAPPDSSPASRTPSQSSERKQVDSQPESESQPKKGKDTPFLECARICAVFTQTTVVLENHTETPKDDLKTRIQEASAALPRARTMFGAQVEEVEGSEEGKVTAKVGRSLERLRRAGVRVVETRGKGGLRDMEALRTMLVGIVDVLAEVGLLSSVKFCI